MMQPMNGTPPPLTAFFDGFNIDVGSWGVRLRFMLTDSAGQSRLVGDVTTSMEHLKVITFLLCRNILVYEKVAELEVKVPRKVLEQVLKGVPEAEWQNFWYGWKHGQPFGGGAIKDMPTPVPTPAPVPAATPPSVPAEPAFPFTLKADT